MTDYFDFTTPIGRLVQGGPGTGTTKDMDGNPLVYKSGPDIGKPRTDYFMGVAIEKTNPLVQGVLDTLNKAGASGHPKLFGPDGKLLDGVEFSMKVTDGDSTKPNKKGIRPCDRVGFPGCWVFGFTTSSVPECYSKGGAERIRDAKEVKRGYYIRVQGSARANDSSANPGIYLNPQMVELAAYGEEISTRPDGKSVFGSAPEESLPAGASQAPVDAAPAAPSAPEPPAPPATKKYIADGVEYTREQLVGFGWTEAQIKSVEQ